MPKNKRVYSSVAKKVGRIIAKKGYEFVKGRVQDRLRESMQPPRRQYSKPKISVMTRKRRDTYHTRGKFAGSFKKGKNSKTPLNKYSNKGVVSTTEISGTVADPDCCYVTHMAVDGYSLIAIGLQALIRKLFEKNGLCVKHIISHYTNKTCLI